MHGWYKVVGYLNNDKERKLACWLGPAVDYGGGDSVILLPSFSRPIVRSTCWSLTPEERTDKRVEIAELLGSINKKIGDTKTNRGEEEEISNNQLPLVDIFGDWNDAPEAEENLLRSDAANNTPKHLISI